MSTTILGANGKLGAMLAQFADQAGLNWQTQARHGSADVIWSGDFNDSVAGRIFRKNATVINMIGYTGPDTDALHEANVVFVERLLTKARDTGVAHVILASSAAIYGAGTGIAFTETAPPQPINAYGVSKAAMETAALNFAAGHATPAITILRISNVGGADALTDAAARNIAARTAMPLHRFADGTAPERSYIGPQDLFDSVRTLAVPFDGPPRVINVAHPQTLSLDAILLAYREHIFPNLEWIDKPVPKGVPQSVTLSTDTLYQSITPTVYNDPADAMARQVAKVVAR